MGAMRRMMVAVCSSLAATGAVHAADAVQWRVEDGGNGHWYQRVAQQHTWEGARLAAQSSGGHLATITSQGEQDFLTAIGAPEYWLGGVAPDNQGCGPGAWTWVTGEPMSYLGWASGEPGTCSHTCMAFAVWAGYTGRWNNDMCTRPDAPGFMIEWSADCNDDGIVDFGQIRAGQLSDSNANNIPDVCEAGFASATANSGVAPTIPLRDFDTGEGLTVGITPDGSLIKWGSYAVTPPAGAYASVSTGRNCAIAIQTDGTLIPFGANEYGRLNVPAGTFRSVSAADASWHAAAIRTDGTMACWGYNNHGQANAPAGTFTAVAAGGHEVWSGFTVAVRTDGTLAAWGNNTWGQRNVTAGNSYRKVAAGYYHAAALRLDGTLAAWGWNNNGQSTPVPGQFVDVACGGNTVALRMDGSVVAMGGLDPQMAALFDGLNDCTKVQVTCCDGAVALRRTDCDANGAIDAVEVAADPSRDANSNGVLDLCESTLHVPSQYATIQAAINAVPTSAARTIQVAAGTYPGPIDFLGKDIVLVGAGVGQSIIDGNGGQVKSVVYVEGSPATARLEGFTIRNGTTGQGLPDDPASLCGGGLLAVNSAFTVRNCRFEDNYATYGGGAYFRYGSAKVENCEFVANVAASRGGGSDAFESTTSFADCFYYDNRAAIGGGMQLVRGQHVVERTRVEQNFAGGTGGGVHWYADLPTASLVLRDSEIVDNTSKGNASGLSIFLAQSSAQTVLEGTTVCGNLPRNIEGGPYAANAASEVCDCRADVVFDGTVGAPDLSLVLGAWGPAAPGAAADINMDGVVNAADVTLLLASWGACASE